MIHNRRSIRLKGYNYSQSGLYFITICTENRLELFGKIINGVIVLNDAGKMVSKIWNEIPYFYNGFKISEFVVMPNHIHGIIEIAEPVGAGPRACPELTEQPNNGIEKNNNGIEKNNNGIEKNNNGIEKNNNFIQQNNSSGQPQGVAPTGNPMTLPDIVHRFKTLTTKRYVDGVKKNNWQSFIGKLWQRNYYEHIIRDNNAYQKIAKYIINNPINWERDHNHLELTIMIDN